MPDGRIGRAAIQSKIVLDGYQYWLARAGSCLPDRSAFDPPIEIPALARCMMLMDVRRDPLDFLYRYVGIAVRPHLTADWTGWWMSDISFQRAPSSIWSYHQQVAEIGEPLFIQPDYVGPMADYLFVEAALLPLSREGRTVDKIMIFVDFLRPPEPPRVRLSAEYPPATTH